MNKFLFFIIILFPLNLYAATSVTVGSITWTFDADYQVGQFVTGDWYVVAPSGVTINSISPTWDGTDNGSMNTPIPGYGQGYTTQNGGYDDSLNIETQLPYTAQPGAKIISSTSRVPDANHSYIDEMAILTVVDSVPPPDAFRPGYCDSTNSYKRFSDINLSKIPNVYLSDNAYTPSEYEDNFARPWVDHQRVWEGRMIHPANNMPDYGRDMASQVGTAVTILASNYSLDEKKSLLIGFLQYGIDTYSIINIAKNNGYYSMWPANGGHSSGRKLPVLIAGLLFNDVDMLSIGDFSGDYILSGSFGNPPADYYHFGEDDQTFYVTQEDVDCTNDITCTWNPDDRASLPPQRYDESLIGMPEWGIRHANEPNVSDACWVAMYRQCCTGFAFISEALGADLFKLKEAWNHDVFFDYTKRYFEITQGNPDPFGYVVTGEASGYSSSTFVTDAWRTFYDKSKHAGTTASIQ